MLALVALMGEPLTNPTGSSFQNFRCAVFFNMR